MPAHHPGLVITDITVTKCSGVNVFSSCKLDSDVWHRIEKHLYLGSGWVSSAYIHIKRKKEEELLADEKVIVDITIGRLDPSTGVKGEADEKWESRPAGLWLKRSAKRHASDSAKAITAVDVLFGADAVDPRIGWEVVGTALLFDTAAEGQEARLSVRRGKEVPHVKPIPRVNENGKFKIMQVSDLHLSTGTGKCRDAEPADLNGGHCEADPRTLEFVGKLLDQEKPDLVVLSGDQVNGETAPDAQSVCLLPSLFHLCSLTFAGNLQIRRTPNQTTNPLRNNLRKPRRRRLPPSSRTNGPHRIPPILPLLGRPRRHRWCWQLLRRRSCTRELQACSPDNIHARHTRLFPGRTFIQRLRLAQEITNRLVQEHCSRIEEATCGIYAHPYGSSIHTYPTS